LASRGLNKPPKQCCDLNITAPSTIFVYGESMVNFLDLLNWAATIFVWGLAAFLAVWFTVLICRGLAASEQHAPAIIEPTLRRRRVWLDLLIAVPVGLGMLALILWAHQ